jgi:hypothetical protein
MNYYREAKAHTYDYCHRQITNANNNDISGLAADSPFPLLDCESRSEYEITVAPELL